MVGKTLVVAQGLITDLLKTLGLTLELVCTVLGARQRGCFGCCRTRAIGHLHCQRAKARMLQSKYTCKTPYATEPTGASHSSSAGMCHLGAAREEQQTRWCREACELLYERQLEHKRIQHRCGSPSAVE